MKNCKTYIKIYLLILFVVSGGRLFAQTGAMQRVPYLFDAGPAGSPVQFNSRNINEESLFNYADGFGWIVAPKYSFENKRMYGTTLRNDLTIDGVTGKEIGFKANIPAGKWLFTFWMEAGNDYTNSAKLKINGDEKKINWFRIKAGEEGESQYMNLYRVYNTLINVNDNGFTFNLIGGKDSVRILGISLIPYEKPATSLHTKYENLVTEAGKYKSKIAPIDLQKYFSEQAAINPSDPYTFYLYHQTTLFMEADRLLNMMGWEWASKITGLGIFDRLHQVVCLLDAQLEHDEKLINPFRERALWMRGKLCSDLNVERGGIHEREIAKNDLAELYSIYPDDENLAMFNGVKIDQPDYCDCSSNESDAPAWALLQKELICRLSGEIKWWVNERQAPNGEFGGKIGDDVELLRWWTPFLLSGNKDAIKGWKKLADEVWKSPKVHNGYSKYPIDVEHGAEFISDSTPELIFVDEDSVYFKRLYYTAGYFENLWSAKNKFGRRFFKSAWYSSTEVDERAPRNRDLDYNSRAVKPLRYLAWSTRQSHLISLLNEWSEAWLQIALSTDKYKPKGLIPSSVRGYDEAINGDGENWYKSGMFWDYFDWRHSVGSMMLDQLYFTYTLNNNSKLLEPIILSLDLIQKNFNSMNDQNFTEGSEKWAVAQIIKNYGYWDLIGKWRLHSGNSRYDQILLKYGNSYLKYRLTKNEKFLVDGLEEALDEIRYNTPRRTTLVLHTDRVRTQGADLLKAMLTGDGTPEGSSPYYAVTWENASSNFTALVTVARKDRLSIETFSFGKESMNIIARIWQLQNGEYDLLYKDLNGNVFNKEKIIITAVGQRINISLPAMQLSVIDIIKKYDNRE